MNRQTFLKRSALLTAGALAASQGWSFSLEKDLLLGHGSHRYVLRPHWGPNATQRVPIKDAHEMVQSKDGRLFLLTNDTRNNVLVFNTNGQLLTNWGREFPGGHGLTLHDEGGTEYLYLTDYERHEVYKATLDGQIVMTLTVPLESGEYTKSDQFKPTETAIGPDGTIYVADGYGLQWISVFEPNGRFKSIFGGPKHFQNAHGICLDTRTDSPSLLISARAQQQLKRFSLDGQLLSTIDLEGAQINRAVIKDNHVYLSVLKSASRTHQPSGFIMILDEQNKVISCPGGSDPAMVDQVEWHQTIEVFQHPHDVCVDRNDNLYIPQWNAGGVYPFLLERVG